MFLAVRRLQLPIPERTYSRATGCLAEGGKNQACQYFPATAVTPKPAATPVAIVT